MTAARLQVEGKCKCRCDTRYLLSIYNGGLARRRSLRAAAEGTRIERGETDQRPQSALTPDLHQLPPVSQCIAKFEIEGETWTLELQDEGPKLSKGDNEMEADVELRASEENFVKIVMGKLSPQTV